MEGFILIYGAMTKIVTDMATECINRALQELYALMKVERVNSTPYHHENTRYCC